MSKVQKKSMNGSMKKSFEKEVERKKRELNLCWLDRKIREVVSPLFFLSHIHAPKTKKNSMAFCIKVSNDDL